MASQSRQPPSKKQKTEKKGNEGAMEEVYKKLEDVQEKLELLNEEAADEIIQIEKKYNTKRYPFYEERGVIIRKIPGFWKKTFLNHDILCDCLSESDQEVFDYVTDLNVENFDIKGGFKISFKFKQNPWFKNETLFKEFLWNDDGQLSVVVSPIEWKKGEDPFKKEDQESFFSMWFRSEEDENDEVADIIKDEIWPDPSKFFHGLIEEGEGVEGEAGDNDSEGDE